MTVLDEKTSKSIAEDYARKILGCNIGHVEWTEENSALRKNLTGIRQAC